MDAAARVLVATHSPGSGKTVFLVRALNALSRLAREVGDQSLQDAASAPSDYEVLLRALENPQALAALRREDPLAPARLRGLHSRTLLIEAEEGAVSATEAASLLGLTRQGVDKRRRLGRLIGLTTGRRGYVYPFWQFGPDGEPLPGLESVLAELHEHDPWMQVAFLPA